MYDTHAVRVRCVGVAEGGCSVQEDVMVLQTRECMSGVSYKQG
jgi:hypothetical protein